MLQSALAQDWRELKSFECSLGIWSDVRKCLASASLRDYEEASELGRCAFTAAPLPLRCVLAYVFPTDSELAEACLQDVLAGTSPAWQTRLEGYVWCLLSCSLSHESAQALCNEVEHVGRRRLPRKSHVTAYTFAVSLVDMQANPSPCLALLSNRTICVEEDQEVALASCQLVDTASAMWVACLLELGIASPLPENYFQRHPQLTHAVLAEFSEARDTFPRLRALADAGYSP